MKNRSRDEDINALRRPYLERQVEHPAPGGIVPLAEVYAPRVKTCAFHP